MLGLRKRGGAAQHAQHARHERRVVRDVLAPHVLAARRLIEARKELDRIEVEGVAKDQVLELVLTARGVRDLRAAQGLGQADQGPPAGFARALDVGVRGGHCCVREPRAT